MSTNDFTNEYKKKVDALQTLYRFKGNVETLAELNSKTDNNIGDVWKCKEDGNNYCWNRTEWVDVGTDIDLSNCATKTELEEKVETTTKELKKEIQEVSDTVITDIATQEKAGLMSKEDKAKLDTLKNTEIIQKDGEATTENVYSAEAVKSIVEKINKTKLDSSIITQINNFENETVTNYAGYNNSYYYKHGSKVHIHLGIKIDTTEFITIFTMPEGFRPKSLTGALGIGSSPVNSVGIQIDNLGRIQTQTSNGYCNADIEFDVFN